MPLSDASFASVSSRDIFQDDSRLLFEGVIRGWSCKPSVAYSVRLSRCGSYLHNAVIGAVAHKFGHPFHHLAEALLIPIRRRLPLICSDVFMQGFLRVWLKALPMVLLINAFSSFFAIHRHVARDGALQDGVVQEASADVSTGLLLSVLPQREGQATDAGQVALPEHALSHGAPLGRVARQPSVRER